MPVWLIMVFPALFAAGMSLQVIRGTEACSKTLIGESDDDRAL
jgi:hypothetical protein